MRRYSTMAALSAMLLIPAIANATPPAAAAPVIAAEPKKNDVSAPSASRNSLLGTDADHDGIRDDIEALVASRGEDMQAQATKPVTSPVRQSLAGLGHEETRKRELPRRSCFDYMMLSPKDRGKADLRMQGLTDGLPGTHPCDPVVSPLLERPFETDFVQLDLGPAKVNVPH